MTVIDSSMTRIYCWPTEDWLTSKERVSRVEYCPGEVRFSMFKVNSFLVTKTGQNLNATLLNIRFNEY